MNSEARGLMKEFEGFVAVSNVNLRERRGTIRCIPRGFDAVIIELHSTHSDTEILSLPEPHQSQEY